MLKTSARHAQPGDRMLVDYDDGLGTPVRTAVVTITNVTRLGCGCDRAEADRPGCVDFLTMHLLPASCHHAGGGIDFDRARAAAQCVPVAD